MSASCWAEVSSFLGASLKASTFSDTGAVAGDLEEGRFGTIGRRLGTVGRAGIVGVARSLFSSTLELALPSADVERSAEGSVGEAA